MAGGNPAARGGPSGFLRGDFLALRPGGSHGNHCGRRNMTRAKALRLRSIIESAVQGLDRDTAIEAIGLHPKWAEGSYKAGHAVQHQSNLWKCLQDHDSTGNPAWRPGSAPSLWGGPGTPGQQPWPSPGWPPREPMTPIRRGSSWSGRTEQSINVWRTQRFGGRMWFRGRGRCRNDQ